MDTLKTLANDLKIKFENREDFSNKLTEFITNKYFEELNKLNIKTDVKVEDIKTWAKEYANKIVNEQIDETYDTLIETIRDTVEIDVEEVELILKNDELFDFYQSKSNSITGFPTWCEQNFGKCEPAEETYYCVKRNFDVRKDIPFEKLSLNDCYVRVHPLCI